MRSILQKTIFLFSLAAFFSLFFSDTGNASSRKFFKGNFHTQTNISDGAEINELLDWYSKHGYDFIALTDPGFVPDVKKIKQTQSKKLLLIPGTEVISGVHMNAINVKQLITDDSLELTEEQLINLEEHINQIYKLGSPAVVRGMIKELQIYSRAQRIIDETLAQGGIPILNHPEFHFGDASQLMIALKNLTHVEIWNANTSQNLIRAQGIYHVDDRKSAEQMWDDALSEGAVLYGVATDDAHDLAHKAMGKGWVGVWAKKLSLEDITAAFKNGDFYSSSGVIIKDLHLSRSKLLTVQVDPKKNENYTIQFIGWKGKVLKEVKGSNAEYHIRGDERYVRVKIINDIGRFAWTQPVFLDLTKNE